MLRQHHDAGGVLVEAVDDVTPRILVLMFQMVNATTVEGVHFKPIRRHRKQAMGFVHHQKSVVFVQHIKINGWSDGWRRCALFRALALKDFHGVACNHLGFRSMYDLPVDDDAPLGEHFSEGGRARLRKHGAKHRQKIAGRGYCFLHLASPTRPTRQSIRLHHPIDRVEAGLTRSHWQGSPNSPNLGDEVDGPSCLLPSKLRSRGEG